MVKKSWKKYRKFPTSQQAFEAMLRDLDAKSLTREIFRKKSSCPRVLKRSINCKQDVKIMMRSVMCRAWYKVPPNSSKDLLVESFRKNLRSAWDNYNQACGR